MCVFFFLARITDLRLDLKNRRILSFKKNENERNKKQRTRGGSVCSGDGGGKGRTKKISPKGAMHLVVVL